MELKLRLQCWWNDICYRHGDYLDEKRKCAACTSENKTWERSRLAKRAERRELLVQKLKELRN